MVVKGVAKVADLFVLATFCLLSFSSPVSRADDSVGSEVPMEVTDFHEKTPPCPTIVIKSGKPKPSKKVKAWRRLTLASGAVIVALAVGASPFLIRKQNQTPTASYEVPPISAPVEMKPDPTLDEALEVALSQAAVLDSRLEKLLESAPAPPSLDAGNPVAASNADVPVSRADKSGPKWLYHEAPNASQITGTGIVVFSLKVAENGSVAGFTWIKASGDPQTDGAIEAAVKKWVFEGDGKHTFQIDNMELRF